MIYYVRRRKAAYYTNKTGKTFLQNVRAYKLSPYKRCFLVPN